MSIERAGIEFMIIRELVDEFGLESAMWLRDELDNETKDKFVEIMESFDKYSDKCDKSNPEKYSNEMKVYMREYIDKETVRKVASVLIKHIGYEKWIAIKERKEDDEHIYLERMLELLMIWDVVNQEGMEMAGWFISDLGTELLARFTSVLEGFSELLDVEDGDVDCRVQFDKFMDTFAVRKAAACIVRRIGYEKWMQIREIREAKMGVD